MIDVNRTVISQYGNSPTILQLVANVDGYIDPRDDIDNIYAVIWNIDTARGFGLDILGRIVGVGRYLQIAADNKYFGFGEATGSQPFDQAPFYDGVPAATQTYRLADEPYRTLILLKAMGNISAPTMPVINQMLSTLFADRGRCYVNEMGEMRIRYTFEFTLTPTELAIVTNAGVIPRPAGVSATVLTTTLPLFGFAEAGASAAPFGSGTFISEAATHAIL